MPKIILITGASTGFGRDMAETLAGAGHRVFATMRDPQGRNRAPAQQLAAAGIAVIELEITSDASVADAVDAVLAESGRIDVLINNAGIAAAGVTEAFTADQARVVFNTNVVGLLRMARAVLPAMRTLRQGLIVNIGSVLGRVTFPFFGIYCASKFAVEALSDSLRYELSGLDIEVALIEPGLYPTPLYTKIELPADQERIAAYGSLGEIPDRMFRDLIQRFEGADAPDPREVAEAVARLIEQPKGSRPARTVVGAAFGADAINAATASAQAKVLEALGLAHLAGAA